MSKQTHLELFNSDAGAGQATSLLKGRWTAGGGTPDARPHGRKGRFSASLYILKQKSALPADALTDTFLNDRLADARPASGDDIFHRRLKTAAYRGRSDLTARRQILHRHSALRGKPFLDACPNDVSADCRSAFFKCSAGDRRKREIGKQSCPEQYSESRHADSGDAAAWSACRGHLHRRDIRKFNVEAITFVDVSV
ncbi:MAG: hypothetical protein AB1342_07970 [Pseudomonadota bacterium]